MNIYILLTNLYGALHNYKHVPFFILTPFRRFIRFLANLLLPKYLYKKNIYKGRIQKNLVVSLTSFPARIENVWMVIETIKRQTVLPEKIILWLSKEQFPIMENIPSSLLDRQDELFEIRLVDGDIKSHKKFYYASCEFPDYMIVLIDDDIYYRLDMIERLLDAYRRNSRAIICQFGSIMKFDKNAQLLPYINWKKVTSGSTDNNLFFGSGGGTLFTPSKLYKDLTNKELFLELTPLADDVWLNAMARLAHLPIELLDPYLPLPIQGKGNQIKLSTTNVWEGKNDLQIKAISNYYRKKLSIDPFQDRK